MSRKYSVFYHRKQRTAVNQWNWEAGTRTCHLPLSTDYNKRQIIALAWGWSTVLQILAADVSDTVSTPCTSQTSFSHEKRHNKVLKVAENLSANGARGVMTSCRSTQWVQASLPSMKQTTPTSILSVTDKLIRNNSSKSSTRTITTQPAYHRL